MFKTFFIIAWRSLVKNKANTILNISGLAIGIAVCMIIGVWLQREVSFDNFHPNANGIFRITNTFKSESESFSQAGSGTALGAHLPKQLPLIKAACRVFDSDSKIKTGDKQFFELAGRIVDSNFFSFFGFRLIKGQPDQVLQSFNQIVLTERMAFKYFGHENPVGKTLTVDGEYLMTVSGIAENPPLNSHIQFDYVLPYSSLRKIANEKWHYNIDNFWPGGWPFTYIQIDPQQRGQVEKQVNQVVARFSEKEWKENKMSYQYHLQPLRDIHLKSHLRYDAANNGSLSQVNIFSVVGIIVLLLACINYINITTAGAIKRAKETAVRKVIGALKGQLIRQFFLETLLVCTLSTFLGILFFKIVLPFFSEWIGQPYYFPLSVTNLLMILACVILISIIAGIYPAAILSSFKPATALKGTFFQSTQGNLIRKGLVVFQFTISIALIGSILIISQQMKFIKNKSLGYNGKAVMDINFRGEPGVEQQYSALRTQLLKNPHIYNVSKHSGAIVDGLGNGWITTEDIKGNEISTSLYRLAVDTTFLNTYDMKLAAGRFFSATMPTDTSKAVLVNEAAVKTFGWQKPENAIGKRFGKGDDARYVIGVVRDFNFESLHKPVEALLIEYSKDGNRLSLKIDVSHTDDVIDHLKKIWSASFPETPLEYSFIDEQVKLNYGKEQKMQGTFYAFSALSLLIACLGLFGLTTFIVERKVKEIGIRKVLGASITGIVSLLSKDFVKLVLIALLIATPLAWYFMNNWLQDFAYRITINWWTFLIAGSIAVSIALVTVSFQAIKAAIANPVKSLRTE
jgi:putative ABC transport system permease protein